MSNILGTNIINHALFFVADVADPASALFVGLGAFGTAAANLGIMI